MCTWEAAKGRRSKRVGAKASKSSRTLSAILIHVRIGIFLKKKIKAGADYIVTQMFFDNQKFFDFVAKAREEGITVPIIPGLKPLSTLKQLNMIPHRFHVDLPEALIKEVIKCNNNKAVRQVGVEWCVQQSKELMSADVPFLHYYSMGKSDNIKKIAEGVF